MRIRGGGGPTRTNATQGAAKATGAGKAQGAKFAGMVGTTGNATEDAGRQQSAMMAELAELAAALEAGKATKEEASRRFVGLVIKQRFGKNKRGKGDDKLEEAVTEMVEEDPQFVSKLQSQLKRIAKG